MKALKALSTYLLVGKVKWKASEARQGLRSESWNPRCRSVAFVRFDEARKETTIGRSEFVGEGFGGGVECE